MRITRCVYSDTSAPNGRPKMILKTTGAGTQAHPEVEARRPGGGSSIDGELRVLAIAHPWREPRSTTFGPLPLSFRFSRAIPRTIRCRCRWCDALGRADGGRRFLVKLCR